eukprot:gene10417-19118_t
MNHSQAQGQLANLAVAYSCEYVQIRLEKAVENGNPTELKRLLQEETSLDLNAMNSEGLSPFHKCVMRGNLDCLKILVRHGADIKLATRDDRESLPELLDRKSLPELYDVLPKGTT